MAIYTEDGLDKLLKNDLISIVLSQQKKTYQDNVGWLDEISKLNDNFSKLEAGMKISKKTQQSVVAESSLSRETSLG